MQLFRGGEAGIHYASSCWQARYTYDPVSLRLTEFYANGAYCRMAGLDPAALCGMVAASELPDLMPEASSFPNNLAYNPHVESCLSRFGICFLGIKCLKLWPALRGQLCTRRE